MAPKGTVQALLERLSFYMLHDEVVRERHSYYRQREPFTEVITKGV